MRTCLLLALVVLASSCSRTIYVVRHAEKAVPGSGTNMNANDPPLSVAGEQRAIALRETLKSKKIAYIYSTNTIRTRSTAELTRAYFDLTITPYPPLGDSTFYRTIAGLKKNTLIVGHSNTVDNIVNGICGSKKIAGDLPETEYDNLFVIKKKGKKIRFENRKYGAPSAN